MRDEMSRSKGIVPAEAYAEYEQALAAYEKLEIDDDSAQIARNARRPRDEQDQRFWLENMVWDHRFTPDEIRKATGLGLDAIETALTRLNITDATRPPLPKDGPIRVRAVSRRPASAHRLPRRRDRSAARHQDQRLSALGPGQLCRGRCAGGHLLESGAALPGRTRTFRRSGRSRA